MGANVLPFAVRRPVDLPKNPSASRLVVVARTARLALVLTPRHRPA